jgi:hypothetical protein
LPFANIVAVVITRAGKQRILTGLYSIFGISLSTTFFHRHIGAAVMPSSLLHMYSKYGNRRASHFLPHFFPFLYGQYHHHPPNAAHDGTRVGDNRAENV